MEPHPSDPAYHDGVNLLAVIRVGALQVPVFSKVGLADSDDKDDTVGLSVYYPYTHILIDSRLGPQARAMTMMHELFHVMSDCGGFSLTERQVTGLEHTFTQVIQDNTEVLSSIFVSLQRRDLPQPVLDCLQKASEEVEQTSPSLDERGVNLN